MVLSTVKLYIYSFSLKVKIKPWFYLPSMECSLLLKTTHQENESPFLIFRKKTTRHKNDKIDFCLAAKYLTQKISNIVCDHNVPSFHCFKGPLMSIADILTTFDASAGICGVTPEVWRHQASKMIPTISFVSV